MMRGTFRISTHLYLLVGAVALPLVALLAYAIYTAQQTDLERVSNDAYNLARIAAANARTLQKNGLALLDRLVRRPMMQNPDPNRCDPIFREFIAANPAYANLTLINRDGLAVCSSVPQRGRKPTSLAGINWAQRALQGERFVVGTPHLGRITGYWISVLGHPVTDAQGRVRGAIGLPIDLVHYEPLVRDVGLPEGSQMKIIDSRGTVIAHSSDPEKWVGTTDRHAINAIAVEHKLGNTRLTEADGVDRLYGFARVPDTDWYVIAGVPVDAVSGPIRAQLLRNSLITAVITLLVLGLATVIALRIRAPISAIARVARNIAAGQHDTRVPPEPGPAEIAEVAEQFNRMLDARQAEEKSLRMLNRAIEASMNAVVISRYDPAHDHPIEYVNPAFEEITGYAASEAIGRNCRFLQNGDTRQHGLDALRLAIRTQREEKVVLRNYRKDGTLFWNELHIAPVRDAAGATTHYVGVFNDITQSVQYRNQLEHQATHDALTGLPNRSLLIDRLNQALVFGQRYGRQLVVAFIDLDQFKYINDSVGHGAGDELLKIAAARLQQVLREGDTVARLGGDEFVLVLTDQAGTDTISAQFEAILRAIAAPVATHGREFTVTCSIGASLYPNDGTDAGTLLKNADVAMYRAKEQGRNNFQFYTREMNEVVSERMWIETHLRSALALDQLVLHYQPKVSLRSGTIVGVEALIRWQPPHVEMVPPSRFIPLAEETGLILPIGEWVLHTACAQAQAWRAAGLPPLSVAVNLSPRQFRDKNLVGTIRAVLADTGLPAEHLELELTESLLMTSIESANIKLNELKAMGIRIAIDDFGTGYSSLSYLKRLPIDHIKIDRSFVSDLVHDTGHAEIAKLIISLGHSLGLHVTAEGVEQKEQLAFLRAHHCDEAQGYYFSKPVPAGECEALLRGGPRPGTGPGTPHIRLV
jgi:diguanylate cyclase (GGDEF)-like protein/PAS domain S-box-containing protein